MKARLGQIQFINCLPLYYGLVQNEAQTLFEVNSDVPARLNQKLVAGQLELSGVSSIVYAQNCQDLLIVPSLSISSFGGLESILLMSKEPIHDLAGKRIGMTGKSATTHRLLKIILKFAYSIQGDYEVTNQSVAEGALNDYYALLLIGDDALYEYHHRQAGYYYYDLGEEWYQFTKLPMVFALWVVQKKFAQSNRQAVQKLGVFLRHSMDYGLLRLPEAAEFYIRRNPSTPFAAKTIVHYLQLLDYGWSEQHQAGLLQYYRLAAELGEIPSVPELEFL